MKHPNTIRLTTIILALTLMIGCDSIGTLNPGDIEQPVVEKTSPAAGATGIDINTSVSITFSEAIDPASVTSSSFRVRSSTRELDGTRKTVGSVITFTPSAPLDLDAEYTMSVSSSIKDLANNPLATSFSSSFRTMEPSVVLPTVTTKSITDIKTTSASGGGSVTEDGNGSITNRGIVWGKSSNPTTSLTTKTSNGTGTGNFSSSITGLTDGTKYFVRAYATNGAGTAYGDEVSFTTVAVSAPAVNTADATSIKEHTASVGGNVTSDGNGTITKRGVVWKYADPSNENLSLSDNTGQKNHSSNSEGSFSVTIDVEIHNVLIRYRTFATNEEGTTYGEIKSFRTLDLPKLVLASLTRGYNKLTFTNYISSFNGRRSDTQEIGFVYSTSENPTLSTGTKVVYPSQYYGYLIDLYAEGLKDNTTYYYNYYVTTVNGTFYLGGSSTSTKTINGYNVKSIRYDNSSTNPNGYIVNTSGTSWTMQQPNNTYIYFTEYARDDWSVYMQQNGGTFIVQIDLYKKQLFHWTTSNTTKNDWFKVWEYYTNNNFTSD